MVDTIVEPVRSSLIPKFADVKRASLVAGALGGGISGSGPSMFMISETAETADAVALAMKSVYAETGIDFNVYQSQIHSEGVRFI